MAVGQGALIAGLSYLAVGRETALGTYSTCTAGFNFISSSLNTLKENKILEQIETSRTYSKRISMNKVVEGDCEFYLAPRDSVTGFIMQNAFGGSVTTAVVSAAASFTHTFDIGNMDQSVPSLCLNARKGPTAGQVWEYSGVRVNEFALNAEMEEALKATMSLVAMDSTQTTNDIAAALTVSSAQPLSFVDGRFSVESTFASLTASSFWHVQNIEFGISNSLKTDNESRRIGTDTIVTHPPGIASFTLNVTMRFDTTTAQDAMLSGTEFAAEFEFQGATMATGTVREGLKLQFPSVYVTNGGDPEIGGPDEVLISNVEFHVLRDDSSGTGYACKAILTNDVANYT